MSIRLFGLNLTDPKRPVEVVLVNAASKICVMGVAAIFAVISTKLIIEHFGVAAYAQYGLLASMATLVPFADLGLGAAIMNTVAESRSPSDLAVRRVLLSAFRVLLCSATAFILIGVILTLGGWWPILLGEGLLPNGDLAALACVIIFALTLPLGVGQRLLNGLGLNHVQIRLQFLAAPFFFCAILIFVTTNTEAGNYLAIFSYLSATLIAGLSLVLAARRVRPQVSLAIRDIPKIRSVRGAKTMHVAWPMLAQMIAVPIAMQSDRLLLSHLGTRAQLAQYNLASQFFGMILQATTAAGIALWPIFAKARARSEVKSPFKLSLAFFCGSTVLGLCLAVALPWILPVVSGGKILLNAWIIVGFMAFVSVEAMKYPLGMYMTDAQGLRFQVLPVFALVPVNLGVSWALIERLGAAGTVIGSVIAVALCQIIPYALYVRRDMIARTQVEKAVNVP